MNKSYVKEYKGYKVPEGASCFVEACEAYKNHFGKKVSGVEYVFVVDNENPEWHEISDILTLDVRGAIPLPEEPIQEWVGGLPPTGCECEALDTLMAHPKYCLAKIKGFYNKQVWLTSEAGVDLVLFIEDLKFRPLKTQEQKDREAFIEKAVNEMLKSPNDSLSGCAERMFNAGFKAPEGE